MPSSTTSSGRRRPTTGSWTCAWRPPPPRGRRSAGCWWPPAAPATPRSSWPGAATRSPPSTSPWRCWPWPRPSRWPGDQPPRLVAGDLRAVPFGDGWADLVLVLNASINYLLEPGEVVAALGPPGPHGRPRGHGGGRAAVAPVRPPGLGAGPPPRARRPAPGRQLRGLRRPAGRAAALVAGGRRGGRDLPPAALLRRRAHEPCWPRPGWSWPSGGRCGRPSRPSRPGAAPSGWPGRQAEAPCAIRWGRGWMGKQPKR